MNVVRNISMAGAALGLVAVASTGSVATAKAVDPGNRMDLRAFYGVHDNDLQGEVEVSCSCTGNWLDRWTTSDGVTHKRVAYADADDHRFWVDYRRDTVTGTWRVELKSIVADGFALPFESDRG